MLASLVHPLMIMTFCICYLGIIFEHQLRINKSAVALLVGVLTWLFYFVGEGTQWAHNMGQLSHHLSDISQILFFLLGAMTIVELIDAHGGFDPITNRIQTRSKRSLLFLICGLSFFLSAILDNLTTTILMISILKKLIPERSERLLLGCLVVVAANAGGAWTPIGDVTTTMLWIGGQITSGAVISKVFLPSLVNILIPALIFGLRMKGSFSTPNKEKASSENNRNATFILIMGLCALIAVPILKAATGLPPFMGMLISLAIMWLITDFLHSKYDRMHLRVPYVLSKIDISGILFFLGILLAVDALEAAGILRIVATGLDQSLGNPTLIASVVGVISAIIDNVPLVAASMGMYDMNLFPTDSPFWLLLTYTAGTGGSLLVVGSSAGVALMGLDKVSFGEYLKVFFPSFIGYVAGILAFLVL